MFSRPDGSELCRIEMEVGEPFDIASAVPGVWHLCRERNIDLHASERVARGGRTVTITLRAKGAT